jgi:hypothetical protein
MCRSTQTLWLIKRFKNYKNKMMQLRSSASIKLTYYKHSWIIIQKARIYGLMSMT